MSVASLAASIVEHLSADREPGSDVERDADGVFRQTGELRGSRHICAIKAESDAAELQREMRRRARVRWWRLTKR